jgi:hypothetical protein
MKKADKETVRKVSMRLELGVTYEPANTDDVNGTHGFGELSNVSYAELKKIFGPPTEPNGDGYKTDVEWYIKFSDGEVGTIYNWKNGKNYEGRNGIPKTHIHEWHTGGYTAKAHEYIEKIIALSRQ